MGNIMAKLVLQDFDNKRDAEKTFNPWNSWRGNWEAGRVRKKTVVQELGDKKILREEFRVNMGGRSLMIGLKIIHTVLFLTIMTVAITVQS